MTNTNDLRQKRIRFLQLSQNERIAFDKKRKMGLLKFISGDNGGYEKRYNELYPPQSMKRGYLPYNAFNAATISKNKMARALEVWNNVRNKDVVFVKMVSKKGAFALTFGKDAKRTAKAAKSKTKNVRVGRHNVEYLQIPIHKLKELTEQLARIDLTSQLVNIKGRQAEIPQPVMAARVVANQIPTPKIDIENSLDKNRAEKRENPLVIESLSIHSDEKGNWRVSGVVNGMSVTARNVAEEDVAAYKKGEMDRIQLATKYHLDKGKKVVAAPTIRRTMTRKYSLEG